MQGNIPSGDVDISAVAEEWTKTVFVTADVIGILLKMFCVHKITQKCDLKVTQSQMRGCKRKWLQVELSF